MTMPGAPMVYYGDEAGMWGGDDPNCRKPMVWPEFNYDSETTHPFGKTRPADEVKFDNDLFAYYKGLISIRNGNKCLATGDINFFLIDNRNDILGYTRTSGEETIIVIINNNNETSSVTLDLTQISAAGESLTDLVTGDIALPCNSIYSFSMKPFQICILK